MKSEEASMQYRARQWAHSESHSPLRSDKEQGYGTIQIVLEKEYVCWSKKLILASSK